MIKTINLKKILMFAVPLLIPLAVGGLSALVTGDMSDMYDKIIQPPYSPPPIVFPIVWSILYLLLGFALYLVVRDGLDKPGVREAVIYFGISLILNFFWSPIFFRWGKLLLALIWLSVMILFAVINAFQFSKINKTAGTIIVIYIAWLLFAFALNLGVYILNGPVV